MNLKVHRFNGVNGNSSLVNESEEMWFWSDDDKRVKKEPPFKARTNRDLHSLQSKIFTSQRAQITFLIVGFFVVV